MRQALQSLADENGFVELPDFVAAALYHPEAGYYRSPRKRVGRNREADFYTSSSMKEAFAAIVAEAAAGMLAAAGLEPGETDWVEIGAEPEAELLGGVEHGFRSIRAIRPGDAIELSGNAVVFSNELLDAQPFRQVRFSGGSWREFGLSRDPESEQLRWTPRAGPHPELLPWLDRLPPATVEGYTIDVPTGSLALARRILAEPWRGVFVAFDYGKTWSSLIGETPQGSARGYVGHTQQGDILEEPGERDITHHICWDDLEAELRERGFAQIALQSQEAFIAHRAPNFLQTVFDPKRSPLDPLRTKLKQLMHPALMGQKFQALTAVRR